MSFPFSFTLHWSLHVVDFLISAPNQSRDIFNALQKASLKIPWNLCDDVKYHLRLKAFVSIFLLMSLLSHKETSLLRLRRKFVSFVVQNRKNQTRESQSESVPRCLNPHRRRISCRYRSFYFIRFRPFSSL